MTSRDLEGSCRTWMRSGQGPSRFRGFTLVELLIAIGIAVTLIALAVPIISSYVERSRVARAKQEIRLFSEEIDAYEALHMALPRSLAELGMDTPLDPWGTPYRYLRIAGEKMSHGKCRKDRFMVPLNSDYDLYSNGKDRRSASPLTASMSQDDVIRANDGEYVGLVSLF